MSPLRKSFLITAVSITLICGSMFWFLRESLSEDWRWSFIIACIWVAGLLSLLGLLKFKEQRQ
jgi:hypothetical protein